MEKIKLAVIGTGEWGKNLVRNFSQLDGAVLSVCCDLDSKKLEAAGKINPGVKTTRDIKEVLSSPEIDAVIIATSSHTHFKVAKEALTAGKHTYVEKPLTLNVRDAEELVSIAKEKKKTKPSSRTPRPPREGSILARPMTGMTNKKLPKETSCVKLNARI